MKVARTTEFMQANPHKRAQYRDKWRAKDPQGWLESARRRSKKYRAAHPERLREYRKKNPKGPMFREVRRRAKKNGIEFTITLADYVIPERCPILGLLLKYGVKHSCDASPTLDRIDSSKGYVKGNVAVISRKANVLKGAASAAQHRLIANWMDSMLKPQTP